MKKTLLTLAVLAGATLTAASVQAKDLTGGFVNLGAGHVSYHATFDNYDLGSEHGTAVILNAGYRTQFIGFEAGYTDLGEFSDQDSSSSTWGLMVNTRGILPIGKHFELDLLFGLVWMQRDLTFGSVSDDVSGTTGKFGIGFAVPVNERLAFNFEYNQYLDFALGFDDDFDLYVDDTTSYSLGVRWKF